jgi:hypothetical protein
MHLVFGLFTGMVLGGIASVVFHDSLRARFKPEVVLLAACLVGVASARALVGLAVVQLARPTR